MRRAARQRRFAGESQRAVIGRNAVSQHAKLRTHANVEILFIRAHHHRLNLTRGINNLNQRQLPSRSRLQTWICWLSGLAV
jgi:hypothetical protein